MRRLFILPTLLVLLGAVLIAAAASGHSEDRKPGIDAGALVSSRRDFGMVRPGIDHFPGETTTPTAPPRPPVATARIGNPASTPGRWSRRGATSAWSDRGSTTFRGRPPRPRTRPPPPPPPPPAPPPPPTTTTTAPPPPTTAPPSTEPPSQEPEPAAGGLLCPVQGTVSFVDSFGAPRSGGRAPQGVDMMAAMGPPTVAPVSGRVEHRGNDVGGMSWWLYGDNGD